MTATLSKGGETAADVSALLRARSPLLWIVTKEEARVERYLIEAAAAASYKPVFWDVAQGATNANGTPFTFGSPDPGDMLNAIRNVVEGGYGDNRLVWILRDLPPWLAPPLGLNALRQLRNIARKIPTAPRRYAQAIIILSPSAEVPPELSGHATVIEWPLPDREEIAAILQNTIDALPENIRKNNSLEGARDAAIDAAIGLSGEEVAACYARSLVREKRIDPKTVAGEKRRVIARERVLEWYDPLPDGLDAVGGLDNLKSWLLVRSQAYTPEARAYGLPAPRGALLVGIPGTGKSLTAKAIATAWGIPLLRLDLGSLKGKFVGESEANIRKAFRVIEAIGRCVVWLDEIEKALAGGTQGAADGGVSSDALGSILSWMQERRGDSFVVATANDVSALPPELLRKGRFDEVWFVDLPTAEERYGILRAALNAHGRRNAEVNLGVVAAETADFTGAEIAALVPEALFAAFADGGRDITTDDLLNAAQTVVPLARTAKEKIDALRIWAKGRARPAGRPSEGEAPKAAERVLDI